MYGFSEYITVYNRLFDPETGYDRYYRTVIGPCSWQAKAQTAQDGTEATRRDIHKIRIPEKALRSVPGKEYVEPGAFTDPGRQFTFSEADEIVRGAVTEEKTRGDSLRGKFSCICTVRTVHDNRRVLPPHLYVEGD